MSEYRTIELLGENGLVTIWLNRPEVRNAFNDLMLTELTHAFAGVARSFPQVRVLVLTGKGSCFCAGADLNWMRDSVRYSYADNLRDAGLVSDCLYALYSLPQPTIARVNGAAIGGGMGLVTACDIAIAQSEAVFSLSEVRIGLVPACISPYVLKRVGEGVCRELFLTGERISAARALQVGLVNKVVSPEELDAAVRQLVDRLLANGPQAMATCKRLLQTIAETKLDEARPYTAEVIARLRVEPEAQEGMSAFLAGRAPSWQKQA
ncbi:MAG: enoyl-CoA hydratase/isomerase family protein [Candidatus Hadarchaeum sp.]